MQSLAILRRNSSSWLTRSCSARFISGQPSTFTSSSPTPAPVPSKIEKQITELRKHISDKADRRISAFYNDTFLQNFINGRKGDLNSAKKYLDAYTRMRFKTYPEFILNSIPIVTRLHEEGNIRVLKSLDPNGCFILVLSASRWNPNPDTNIAAEEWMRECGFMLDYFMLNESSLTKEGIVVIFDCRRWEYKHVWVMTLPNMMKIINIGIKFPIRFKGVHIIMDDFVLKSLFQLVCPFFPHKFASRIQLHETADTIKEHIPEAILPTEFGGKLQANLAYDMEFPNKIKSSGKHYAQIEKVLRQGYKMY